MLLGGPTTLVQCVQLLRWEDSLWHFANISYSQLGLVYCVISLAFQDTYRADGVDISDLKPFSGLGSLRYYSSASSKRPSLRDQSLMVFQ